MAKVSINIATGSLQPAHTVVGIDLGTTNSLIAIIHPQSKQAIALKEHDGSSVVPSIIHLASSGSITVGEAAASYLVTEPERTIYSVKRLLGKTYAELQNLPTHLPYTIIPNPTNAEGMVNVKVNETYYSPTELSSHILTELKKRAEHILKTPVEQAVITVPAYFNDAQRQATRDAGKLAGLNVLRIINEPTAASLAYGIGLQPNDDKTVAVYDLGGGTFDVSILQINNGIFEVLSTNGDTYLGGDDMDTAIVNYWLTQYDITNPNTSLQQALRLAAEAAKKALSNTNIYTTTVAAYNLQLTVEQLNSLITPLIQRTITCCLQALTYAKLNTIDIQEILMVGGSTRVPLVRQMVSEYFGKTVNISVNPDEVVALGAAIQADILAGNNKEVLLLDVTPLSLGIETMGGLMEVLIERNSKIPTKATKQYTTQADGQTGMNIAIYQGERDLVQHNRKLAAFTLKGIPPMPAGLPKVDISFLLNADGILQVTATELRSGINQAVTITPQQNLTDAVVETMLLDSLTNAKEDIAIRALTQAKTEAQLLINTTNTFNQKNKLYLTAEELDATNQAITNLQACILNNDKSNILQATEALNETTRPYAERVMDLAVAAALKGNKI